MSAWSVELLILPAGLVAIYPASWVGRLLGWSTGRVLIALDKIDSKLLNPISIVLQIGQRKVKSKSLGKSFKNCCLPPTEVLAECELDLAC